MGMASFAAEKPQGSSDLCGVHGIEPDGTRGWAAAGSAFGSGVVERGPAGPIHNVAEAVDLLLQGRPCPAGRRVADPTSGFLWYTPGELTLS